MGPNEVGAPAWPRSSHNFSQEEIVHLLESSGEEQDRLFALADEIRAQCTGDAVHLRGIVEFSNYCIKNCLYCGLRKDNAALTRYRMTAKEILETVRAGAEAGLRTIVLQSGEDRYFTGEMLARVIAEIKDRYDVAVTVSVGDRKKSDYLLMRKGGADRYLLKQETADPELFAKLRPGTTLDGRKKRLMWLKELGFQVGSGTMVGLPGQSTDTIAKDMLLMRDLDVEMAGIGPFIPNDDTPLAGSLAGDVDMTLRAVAVARLVMPFAHLPGTTALASMHPQGRQRALKCGANVVMPDITPVRYKKLYRIYPNKVSIAEDGVGESIPRIRRMIVQAGRSVADDYGHSNKPSGARRLDRRTAQ